MKDYGHLFKEPEVIDVDADEIEIIKKRKIQERQLLV